MKKYAYGALAALIAALFLVVGASGFTAAGAAPTVQAGHYCDKDDAGKVVVASNGKTVRCEKDNNKYRWKYFTPPVATSSSGSASQSASASSSATASASASATGSASASTSPTPPPNSASSTDLPLTGAPVGALIGLAAALATLGGLLYLGARRRTRFTAQ